jgi:hypothetical protein
MGRLSEASAAVASCLVHALWRCSGEGLHPVLGYADDAIVVRDAVRAHWPGTDDGFAALARLTGIGASAP